MRFCDEDVMKNIDGVLRAIQYFIKDFDEKHKIHPPESPLVRGEILKKFKSYRDVGNDKPIKGEESI